MCCQGGPRDGSRRGRCGVARWSRVSAVPGRAGVRCPAGGVRCPRLRTAATRPGGSTWPTWPAPTSQRNACAAAVAPERRRVRHRRSGSRTPRPVAEWLVEPDTADAVAVAAASRTTDGVSGPLLSGRLVSAADPATGLRCRPLQEPVARSAAAGRLPPPPVGPGELALQPVAELGAQQGHGGRPADRAAARSDVRDPEQRSAPHPGWPTRGAEGAAAPGRGDRDAQLPQSRSRSDRV
jgi:hypothetical protein